MPKFPYHFQLSQSMLIELKNYCEQEQVSAPVVMFAAFCSVIYRYTDFEQFIFNCPDNLSLPNLKVDIQENSIFSELVHSIHAQDMSQPSGCDWEFLSEPVSYRLTASPSAETWDVTLAQSAETDPRPSGEDMAGHLITFLESALADPTLPVSQYPLLTQEEQEKIVVQWNLNEGMQPQENLCIHQWVERQAGQFPDRTAVIDGERRITYRELNTLANLLARRLELQRVDLGQRVGIYLERSIELVVAMLAVLKRGCAFIALDHAQPNNRVMTILEDAGVGTVIRGESLQEDHQFGDLKIISIETYLPESGIPTENDDSRILPQGSPDDLCFILFTSGSTGKPKGVLHAHRNIVQRYYSIANVIPIGESGVFSQTSPLSSIDAIDEILYPLLWGGATAIIAENVIKDPRRLVQKLEQVQATHILLVPTLLRLILEIANELDTRLRKLNHWVIGGEPLDAALAKDFYQKLPSARLINYYGLTEGDGTCVNASDAHPYSKDLPIGRAAPNVKIYLLNSALQPVPVGIVGEICIGGRGIAQGYLNLPELTAQRFIPDRFSPLVDAKMFRTGDLGRYLPDGTVEFLGRKDLQVKIRGFRVELLEVEEQLKKHPTVKSAVVIPWKPEGQAGGERLLAAYIINHPGQVFSAQDLRQFLASRLPDYAVPGFYIPLAALPLNPNGKVDRKALPEPSLDPLQLHRTIQPPRNQTETRLVKMWEDVLGVSPIGVEDDFFDMGGDSIAGIRFLAQVEKNFKKDLPIDIFFHATTIAEFGHLLDQGKIQEFGSSLIPIQPSGTKPPLFCVHADGGVIIYRIVSQFLGPDYPVYGLQAQGLDGKQEPLGSVEEIATHYIRAIRAVQPHGPYHLGAFSLGGIFIFEMAQQLHAAGENVGLLAFFDAGSPSYPRFPKKQAQWKHKVSVHLISLTLKNPQEKMTYLWRRTINRLQVTLLPVVGNLLQKLKIRLPHSVRYVVVRKTLIDATNRYRAGSYPGEITIFRAKIQPVGCIPDPTMGWGEHVSGHIDVVEIEGNHNTMMKDKYMRLVAAGLKDRIH